MSTCTACTLVSPPCMHCRCMAVLQSSRRVGTTALRALRCTRVTVMLATPIPTHAVFHSACPAHLCQPYSCAWPSQGSKPPTLLCLAQPGKRATTPTTPGPAREASHQPCYAWPSWESSHQPCYAWPTQKIKPPISTPLCTRPAGPCSVAAGAGQMLVRHLEGSAADLCAQQHVESGHIKWKVVASRKSSNTGTVIGQGASRSKIW
eukprot:364063-Chlamydomonas_euryale.AAC.6